MLNYDESHAGLGGQHGKKALQCFEAACRSIKGHEEMFFEEMVMKAAPGEPAEVKKPEDTGAPMPEAKGCVADFPNGVAVVYYPDDDLEFYPPKAGRRPCPP